MLTSDDLKGRWAVVTGAGDGIGRGLALTFARCGMNVVVGDLRTEAADSVAVEVRAHGVEARAVTLDVADAGHVEGLATTMFETFGDVAVLCNNAGVNVLRPVWELTPEDWRFVLSINLGGVVNGIASFVPKMVSRGAPAHIVNTASMAGIGLGSLRTTHMPYATSKFAVVGLTETLACALEPHGIGASVLCPGRVTSGLTDNIRQIRSMLGLPASAGETKPGSALADETALDPMQVGAMTLEAILENRTHIFSHPGRRFEIEMRQAQIVSDLDWADRYFSA